MQLMIYLFLTTLFWGMAAIFDKLALGKTSPCAGMMVRQFILSGILLAVGIGSGRLGSLGTLDGRTIFFFGLSGICGGAAGLWTYYHALRLGGASLVVPITATYPLTHFPQLVVHKGQNSVVGCQKLVGYQPPFFENQM